MFRSLMDGSEAYSIFDARNIKEIFQNFSPKKEIKMVIHGWRDNLNCSMISLFKNGNDYR